MRQGWYEYQPCRTPFPNSQFMLAIVAHLLNFALSLLIWLIIGQCALRILARGRPNFITDLFDTATRPVLSAVRRLTPRFISSAFVPMLAILVLLALRLVLLPALR